LIQVGLIDISAILIKEGFQLTYTNQTIFNNRTY